MKNKAVLCKCVITFPFSVKTCLKLNTNLNGRRKSLKLRAKINGQRRKHKPLTKTIISLSLSSFVLTLSTPLPSAFSFPLPFGLNPLRPHPPFFFIYILCADSSLLSSLPHDSPLQICRCRPPLSQAPLVDAALWITVAWPSGSSPATLDA